MLRKLTLALAWFGMAVTAHASAIFSDGFNWTTAPALFTTVTSGGTIGSWTVGGAGVDWIGRYWQPAEGNGSVDLSGLNAGLVTTPLNTVAGQQYVLSFYLAGNPDGGPAVKSLQVQVGNLTQSFTFDTTGHTKTAMGWILESASFMAVGNDTITFRSQVNTAYGPALDGVTVSTTAASGVPEPATYTLGLFGLMTLTRLFRRHRRQRTPV